ncbi:MAG TPA: hypothetical protein ENJ37_10345 [Deltaproteobacteria bacterium]|nr:hypothetical protein [Deltaproteobacteria bacterium]
MAENRLYLAVGEEAARGVKESTTVGFIPVLTPPIPDMEFEERRREEYRGEAAALGERAVSRMSRKWSGSIETPFFTEAGSTKGMVGTILKHFFGKASSGQNGTTGQYHHMFYPVHNPFDASNLGAKALTLNVNINEGTAMKNWPFVGGRVSALTFEQEVGAPLKLTAELFGQYRDTVTAEIGSPVFAAENLRCDYNNLKVYTGTITRGGTAPDYTDFSMASATRLKPDKVTVKVENGMEDALRLSGLDYPDRTRLGRFKVSLELTIDWEDPASGFSSADEFNNWVASTGETNFLLDWDTGTQAGTGHNHHLYIDVPRVVRTGGKPDYNLDKDPMITLSYEGLYNETTKYLVGVLLKNTAAAV